MHIGLDFDGVISDYCKLKTELAKKHYNKTIPPEEFKGSLVVDKNKILTPEEYDYILDLIFRNREHGLSMEPVHGALEYIQKLQEEHEITIITSRGQKETQIAEKWLQKYNLGMKIIGVGKNTSKADACKELGLNIYIDDDIHKLEPLQGIVPHIYLFSWKYNQHLHEPDYISRVESWKEFYKNIENLE